MNPATASTSAVTDRVSTDPDPPGRLVRSARLIAILTLGSRVLGLVREMVYGFFFGATPWLSSFRVAFQVPNLARQLFGEGALTSSFLPVFTRVRVRDGDGPAGNLAGAVLVLLTLLLSLLIVAIEIGLLLASRHTAGPTVYLAALLMPYMLLVCVTAFLGAILNGLQRFAAPAIAPIVLNVFIISGTWLGGSILQLQPRAHFQVVAAAVLLAGFAQIALQWWWLRATGFRVPLRAPWSSPGVRRVILHMGPMVLGMAAVQVNTFVDSLIALFMVADGRGPAVLGYALYMTQLPLAVFGTALATAIFPLLSQQAAASDHAAVKKTIVTGLRTTLFIALPAAVGLILVAHPLVRLLLERGAFQADATARVAIALCCYAAGLWAYAGQQILVRAFYAMQKNRTPVRIASVMVVLNVVLNLLLVRTRLQEAGVALATAGCASIQVMLLAWRLHVALPGIHWRALGWGLLRFGLATLTMAGTVWLLRGWSGTSAGLTVAVCVAGGGLTYFLVAAALKCPEPAMLLGRHRRG